MTAVSSASGGTVLVCLSIVEMGIYILLSWLIGLTIFPLSRDLCNVLIGSAGRSRCETPTGPPVLLQRLQTLSDGLLSLSGAALEVLVLGLGLVGPGPSCLNLLTDGVNRAL